MERDRRRRPSGSPDPGALHRWHRRLWTGCTVVLGALGVFSTVWHLGVVATLVMLAISSAVIGVVAFSLMPDGRPALPRAARVGWISGVAVVVLAGWDRMFGPWGYLLATVVCLTSPQLVRAVQWTRKHWSTTDLTPVEDTPLPPIGSLPPAPGIDMSPFEVLLLESGSADEVPERKVAVDEEVSTLSLDDLCRRWRRSYVLLQQDLPPHSAMKVVRSREQYVAEFTRRYPRGVRAWLAEGGSPSTDPRPYFLHETESQ